MTTPTNETVDLPEATTFRKSPRENAGVPPTHLMRDFVLDPAAKKKNTPTAVTSKSKPSNASSKNESRKSKSSHRSTRQARQAEVTAAQKLSDICKERDDKEKEIKNLELDLAELLTKINSNTDIIKDHAKYDEPSRLAAESQNQSYLQQLRQMEADIRRATTNLEFDQRDYMRREALVRAELDLAKLDATDDSEEGGGSSDDDSAEPSEVEKWAEKTVLHIPADPMVKGKSKKGDVEDEKSASEAEEKKKSSPRHKKKKTHRKSKSSPNKFNLEDIVSALANAINGASLKSSHKMSDKILARQVQGRDLPSFSGHPEEWPGFAAAFETSTRNCGYNNAENLPRLQKCLKGDAYKSVQCLLVDPDGVPTVMEKLKMRFGRPALIIESMIQKLREVPPVKLDRSETFIDFGIAVDNLVSTIKSLKQPQHMGNPTLLQELVNKLPLMTQMDWSRSQKDDSSNLEDFAKWIDSYTQAACKLCPTRAENSTQRENKKGKKPERVYTVSEKNNSGQGKWEKKCAFCSSSHHQRDCPTFVKSDVDQRWTMVKGKRVCFGCLGVGHRCGDCRSSRPCGVDGCNVKHHKLLHQVRSSRSREKEKAATEEEKEENVVLQTRGEWNEVIHMMSPVQIEGPNGKIEVFAILDGLSSITTMESAAAQKLGIVGSPVPLTIKGFNSTKTYQNSQVIDVRLQATNEKYACTLRNVRTVEKIEHSQSVKRCDLSKWSHLQDLDIPTYNNAKPTILIGLDHPQLHVHHEYRTGKGNNEPVAVRTPLGWMIMGRLGQFRQQQSHTMFSMSEADSSLHQMVKEYFTIESLGVSASPAKPRSTEDQRAQQQLDSSLRRVPNGWEVGLLWRDDDVSLPLSKQMALSRLRTMERKMDREPEFSKQYESKIAEYQEKGFAKKLSKEEASVETGKTFYLPHFMAFNPKKPNKFRFVFDAAAKVQGKSLNDFLLRGPDKLSSLPGILLKFRRYPVAITADIQDMFHRVRVKHDDAQAQRFLWRGKERDRDPDVYEMGVLIFGATCSPTCAQEAKNRNALEYRQQYPSACEAIIDKHYVDDLLDSVTTVQEAVKLFHEVREVHSKGGFNLCNWLSNSREVMQEIPEELRAKSVKSLDFSSGQHVERVLGLFWRHDEDAFTFSLTYLKAQSDVLKGGRLPSKREVLSLVMSLYDPLGFLSILTIRAKMIIQKCWTSETGWDDVIPEETREFWRKWLEELQNITKFQLPRCLSPNLSKSQDNQLHVFGDASEEAYGAVVYLRMITPTGIEVSLISAKAKVAPIKVVSIPRLELQAAVLGTRLQKFIKEEMSIPINRVVFWSDSSTVIHWIRSDGRRFQQFVAHRIGEIQENTEIKDWRWIPTNENVADEMTRIDSKCDFSVNSRWIRGPEFLRKPEEEWPVEKLNPRTSNHEWELKKVIIHAMKELQPVIDISRFSKWKRLLNATAYMLRFARRVRPARKIVEPEEFAAAERWWWIQCQRECYPNEVAILQQGHPLPRTSRLQSLTVGLDEFGVMRVRGRLDNADIPTSVRSPVVSVDTMVTSGSEVRQQYFIPSLRNAIRTSYANCQQCKNERATPQAPEMGQLPRCRVEMNVRPFYKTGLDYFGPIDVVVKRSRVKRYVALFTCLSTRAVHLEIAGSLSTDSCIMAIRRFVCRRGCPSTIHSDNGTNFHGANNELKSALAEINQDKMNQECNNRGIRWSFLPPSSPHMGGSWERMVRSVKKAMGSVLQMKDLSEEVLHTVLLEAEHTVNSHPLTHVADDPDDPEALTPNHFLLGQSSNLQPMGKFTDSDIISRKHWRISQHLVNQFWRRWVKEFLPTLLRRQKWCQVTRPIQIGDVIIEVNPNFPRNSWPKGRVVELFPGKDQVVRVVSVKLSNGHIFRRPVAKLCILDVQSSHQDNDKNKDKQSAATK
ncbi:Pro-Pol polyprotein [Folsomia candida]|uniref:Pro-Pol polyprotein n=2 Tax=Folsomia candida TaxID=158441 RepID=A0A226EEI4_FOLCA|nr:Pro-Pol polyprotein [Folsomia candida]